MAKALRGFNAYGYTVLSDRGYGKVKDRQQVEHTGADGQPPVVKLIIQGVESDGNGNPRVK
jgi:hypothetical protein